MHRLRIEIRANEPGVLERFEAVLPPIGAFHSSTPVHRLYTIECDGEGEGEGGGGRGVPAEPRYTIHTDTGQRVASMAHLEEALDAFESDVQLFVAQHSGHGIFVHAGVVGWRGRALVIPGRSFAGKSTLVSELIRAGAEYLSDEYAVFDDDGRVHAYPRPLKLREEGRTYARRYEPEAFGARVAGRPLPVGMILATSYEEGAEWKPRRMTSGEAMLALLDNTVAARSRSSEAMGALRAVVATPGLRAYESPRGDAAALALRVLDMLGPARLATAS